MAKNTTVNVMLWHEESGDHYTIKKSVKRKEKLQFMKYSRKLRKHVLFVEKKLVYKAN